jgi:hypothetical protein
MRFVTRWREPWRTLMLVGLGALMAETAFALARLAWLP